MFTVPERDLERFALATGPGVPLEPEGASLLDPRLQDVGETPRLTSSLFTALTGRDATSALVCLDRAGVAMLSQCSEDFVDSMAAANMETIRLAEEDRTRGDDSEYTTSMRHLAEISAAWMKAGRWPREVVGLENRLTRTGWARIAREKGQHVYAWHGPAVETYRLVSGRGPYPSR